MIDIIGALLVGLLIGIALHAKYAKPQIVYREAKPKKGTVVLTKQEYRDLVWNSFLEGINLRERAAKAQAALDVQKDHIYVWNRSMVKKYFLNKDCMFTEQVITQAAQAAPEEPEYPVAS